MGNKRLCLLELAQPSVEPPCIPRSGAETICDRRIKNALDSGTIAASSFLRLLNFAAIMKEKEEIPICAKNAQIFLGLTIDQLEKLRWHPGNDPAVFAFRDYMARCTSICLHDSPPDPGCPGRFHPGKGSFSRVEARQQPMQCSKPYCKTTGRRRPRPVKGRCYLMGRYLTPRMFRAKVG